MTHRPLVVRVIGADVEVDASQDWPWTIPAVQQILREGLNLSPGVTFLVGDNGAGKSTLIEGIAEAFGLSPEGGSIHIRRQTRRTESSLGRLCLAAMRNCP